MLGGSSLFGLLAKMDICSALMRHVGGLYTQGFNHRHRRDGSLFGLLQGDFSGRWQVL